jgi:RNA polymerase sigma factor (sigma-70 family)
VDTTEELCQRIWINLAHCMSSFQYDPSRKFRGWLRRLCHSRAVDLFRERRAHAVRFLVDEPSHAARQFAKAGDDHETASRCPELLRLGKQVHDSVKCQVEPQTWNAFWSIAVEGHTIRETADILKMSYAAAFAAHKRVVSRLRAEGRRVLLERMDSGIVDGGHDDGPSLVS